METDGSFVDPTNNAVPIVIRAGDSKTLIEAMTADLTVTNEKIQRANAQQFTVPTCRAKRILISSKLSEVFR